MNPSQLVLKLTWDNEMPASSDFTFLWRKKSDGAICGEPSGWRTVFMSLPPFEVWTESSVWPSSLSLYKNQSWDNSLGLFSLKMSWELARVLLMPDFLNSSSDSNYDIGGPVHHFGNFLSFNSFN
jgi:hypothetical protein